MKREKEMYLVGNARSLLWLSRVFVGALAICAVGLGAPVSAADSMQGQVLGGGAPIAKSTVTLWSASADAQKQSAQTHTGDDGRSAPSVDE